jgi:hypothetical protein
VSVVNHEKTMESIATMGARLAEEVSQVMAELEAGELTPRGGGRTPRLRGCPSWDTPSGR